ncbi:D-beta-hydroxybutyrate dehydrogenase [subsurface metagenome]
MKLEGRTALITGSSRGVGQQIAMGLAELGAKIIVHGRRTENIDQTIDMLGKYDVEVFRVEGDLSVNTHISKITGQIVDKFGGVDILYNNAAIMSSFEENIWEHSLEAWEKTFRVNLYALYFMCSAFIPGMIRRGYGRVINLTSGIKDQPELAPYSASKAAVDKLTQDIAVKLENTGVRINILDPGWLKTDMGGPNAWYDVGEVLLGALVPALIEDDGPNGKLFSAIELKDTKL